MRTILSILSVLSGLAVFHFLGSTRAQEPFTPRRMGEAESFKAGSSAQSLLKNSEVLLLNTATLDCKIRQQVDLLGYQLIGSGSYQQQWQGRELHSRLELRLQVAGEVSSLLEVSDGRWLWIDRQLPSGQAIGRIDLHRVRNDSSIPRDLPPAVPGFGLSVGGLPQLVAGLAANFNFVLAQEDEISGVPLYVIRGTWKESALRSALHLEPEQPVDQ